MVKRMGRWKGGKENGCGVGVKYSVGVVFRLE